MEQHLLRWPTVLARFGRLLLALGFCAILPALVGAVSEQDFLCEEAAQRLKDCCPDADFRDDFCQAGCGSEIALSVDESECIRKSSCDRLRDQQICERVLARNSDASSTASSGSVCP
jgi:hypothetical protein